jgi:membrane protein
MSKLTRKGFLQLLKNSFKGFGDDKVVKLSGSLAYFTVFSIGPMLIVIIYFADIFYGRAAVEGTIFRQMQSFIGPGPAEQVQSIIRNATLTGQSKVAATLGFVTLLIGATGVFAEIQDSINMIWNLKPKPKHGFKKLLLNRLLSFSVVIGLGFILLASLVINSLIEGLMDRLQESFPHVTVVLIYIVNLLLTFVITTLLFGIIFKVLPDAIIKWKDVLTGAIVTALLFMLGKFAITFYIGRSNFGTTYGAAGSIVILLSWIYYSSIILYFGAEFTKSWANLYGGHIEPSHYAVWVKQIEVEDGKGSLKQQEAKKQEENESTGDDVTVK